ncbi:MAG: tRNA 4-thiouridine(8) synthase ThiI, partial [Methanobacteriota archaeon]
MTESEGFRQGVVMVRYGEIFLKSEPVKRRFIGQLSKNIAAALDARGLPHSIEIHRGRILVYGDDTEAIAAIASRIFGVVDASVCASASPTREGLAEAAVTLARQHLRAGQSFAVRARRQGVEEFSSQELGALVGEAILDAVPGISVDLTCPDYEVFVEAREYGGFVCDNRLPAPGGLPWSTQGRVLGLISGGLDSPVASWLMMRRGREKVHLYLDGGCWVGRDRRVVVESHHRLLSTWCMGYPLELYIANSEPFFDA